MRPPISLLFLTLAFAAKALVAQEDAFRIAPLVPGPVPANPVTLVNTIITARSAQELGFPGTAAGLYREAITQASTAAERIQLTMALTTALLDNGDVAGAEGALNSLAPPHDSAWNLRAGLVQVQKRDLPRAGSHNDAIKPEELTPEDKGWWFLLQGRIADAAGEAPRAQNFYEQAVTSATSATQKLRFQLSREEIFVRTGTLTETFVEQQRQNMVAQRGTEIGIQFTIIHAATLNEFGRRAQAINVLQELLTTLLPFQREARDQTWLQLGLIATTKTDAGRTALLQLLENGTTPDFQRMALLLLANEPLAAADFRRRLDALLARPEAHAIQEDLLMKRAQLAAAEKTAAGYAQAKVDANKLLASFPGSVLKAPVLALLAAMEWEQRRYLGAANFAAEAARAAAKDPASGARLGLLEAEALFRAATAPAEYRRAATAYAAVLLNRPAEVPAGDLLFQRLQAEIEATDFSVAAEVARPTAVLDQLAADPDFDVVNRWQAEWNLARKLRAANQFETAYRRVNNLLAPPATAPALPPELRARMAWLQAQLSLEAGQPEVTIRRAAPLSGALANVAPGLAAEIRSTSVLLQGRAELALGREKDALATFDRLQREFRTSEAAENSVLIQGAYLEGKGQLTEAQGLYRRMENDFPAGRYVDQALYRAALIDVGKNDKMEAANRLDDLARKYPKSPLVFTARLTQADLLRELMNFGLAQQTYERLIQDFPNDPRVFDADMGLADCLFAQATGDPSAAERAAEKYERLLDLAAVRLDLRVAAGYKLGLVRVQRAKPEEAQKVWWTYVIQRFLLDESQAVKLGSSGRDWMGKTLTDLAALYDGQNKPDQARDARGLLVKAGLLGKENAALQLAVPVGGGGR